MRVLPVLVAALIRAASRSNGRSSLERSSAFASSLRSRLLRSLRVSRRNDCSCCVDVCFLCYVLFLAFFFSPFSSLEKWVILARVSALNAVRTPAYMWVILYSPFPFPAWLLLSVMLFASGSAWTSSWSYHCSCCCCTSFLFFFSGVMASVFFVFRLYRWFFASLYIRLWSSFCLLDFLCIVVRRRYLFWIFCFLHGEWLLC